jgi:hypothetical protein
MPNLDFSGADTSAATHGLHAYAARCPPQLVRYGVRYYSRRGETVLDPMMGSGTTLVEAKLLRRLGIGIDIDPLARLIAEVKCSDLDDADIERGYSAVSRKFAVGGRVSLPSSVSSKASRSGLIPVDWFSAQVARDLARLALAIQTTKLAQPVRNFLWVAFSSLILARTSVANARDIIHSRPHRFVHSKPPDVFKAFERRIRTMRSRMQEMITPPQPLSDTGAPAVRALLGDARNLNHIGDRSVDLVFTSPPYATALDYPRAHFLAVAWMEKALGTTLRDYLSQSAGYIGSERGRLGTEDFAIDDAFELQPTSTCVLKKLAQSSPRHAKLVQRYFLDMVKVLGEVGRVLRRRHHAIFVICPSHIRKVPIPTDEVFVELARSANLRLKAQHSRTIDRRRRLLPYMNGNSLGARMSTEYVLVFRRE